MSLSALLPQIKTTFLDLLFPLTCLVCGREGDLLCNSCRQSLPRIEPPLCPKCGITANTGVLCSSCRLNPPSIDGIRSVFIFSGIIRDAIHQLKYKHLKAMAVSLGHPLAEYLTSNHISADIIMPVPLHPKRLRERGYNQALLLANEISKATNIRVAVDVLFRTKNTASQTKTGSVTERRTNVADAFTCNQNLSGKEILLIDDVCTTGSTLSACASVLKGAGAHRVRGLTVARDML